METTSSLVVGIPRALLYHRYAVLWRVFFKELDVKVIVSGPTSRKVLEDGSGLAVDETCLSAKIVFGHVRELIGRCDYILIPRINTFGHHRDMCVRFQSLYDQARNVFRETEQKFLSYNVPDARAGSLPACWGRSRITMCRRTAHGSEDATWPDGPSSAPRPRRGNRDW